MTSVSARRKRASRGSGELLREEIIAATKELLAKSANSDAVSIRAVADAVGVTPPSIYLHFADKDALIEAVCADVFAELDVAMVTAGAQESNPIRKLCAYGLAYVQFAIEHPEHYRLATMDRHGTGEGMSTLDEVLAEASFAHFMAVVADCMAAGIFAEGNAVAVSLELWSAAHGIASLMIAKPFLPWGEKMAFANQVLRSAALGRAVTDLLGGDPTQDEVEAWIVGQRNSGE